MWILYPLKSWSVSLGDYKQCGWGSVRKSIVRTIEILSH